jgi:tetratricopeptide (TPR) repeat protein
MTLSLFEQTRSVILTLALLTLFCSNVYSQSKDQQKLQKQFTTYFCSCLQETSQPDPEKILTTYTEDCVRKFFKDFDEPVKKVVQQDYAIDSLTEYQRGRLLGTDLIQNTIEDLVKDCDIYREAMKGLKKSSIDKMNLTKEQGMNAIKNLEAQVAHVTNAKGKANIYALLAMINEFIGDDKTALSYYNKALEIYPLTSAKAFRTLLKMKK